MKRELWNPALGKAIVMFGGTLVVFIMLNLYIHSLNVDISPDGTTTMKESPRVASNTVNPSVASWELEDREALARPLFSPSRRDFSATPVAVAPAQEVVEEAKTQPIAPKPSFQLLGIQSVNGVYSALIATGSGQPEWVYALNRIGDWQIKSIDADELTITSGPFQERVSLYDGLENHVRSASE